MSLLSQRRESEIIFAVLYRNIYWTTSPSPVLFCSVSSEPSNSVSAQVLVRRKPVHHRLLAAQRSNYDLRERICIGSMTALEAAVYQQVPTDEAEAQMLVSADLDDMKSNFYFTFFFFWCIKLYVFLKVYLKYPKLPLTAWSAGNF